MTGVWLTHLSVTDHITLLYWEVNRQWHVDLLQIVYICTCMIGLCTWKEIECLLCGIVGGERRGRGKEGDRERGGRVEGEGEGEGRREGEEREGEGERERGGRGRGRGEGEKERGRNRFSLPPPSLTLLPLITMIYHSMGNQLYYSMM